MRNVSKQVKGYYSVPRLQKIPFLVHGFGAGAWREEDFQKIAGWRDFKRLSLEQTHSDIVHVIEAFPGKKLRGDALVTSCPRIFLIIKTADCLPVLITDEAAGVIAAVHCGWRGTEKRVIQKTVRSLEKAYASEPDSLLVAMGPSIGPECYEVGRDVFQRFERKRLSSRVFKRHPFDQEKFFLDLKGANRTQLIEAGIRPENIYSVDLCTHCEEALLSFRRDSTTSARMLNFIGKSR